VGAKDAHRLLRVAGWWPTWLLVGAAFAAHDRGLRRAWGLVAPAGMCGLLAEGLKLLVRRERPGPAGEVSFRAFGELPWDSAGLGMPSSHAAVAFGAAFALGRLHPRTLPVGLLLAAGCAATRVVDRAHFLSDCAVAGLLAWLVVAFLPDPRVPLEAR
jgi:membrane-associated phospholipid phosphatase